jgi:hypothetical protein
MTQVMEPGGRFCPPHSSRRVEVSAAPNVLLETWVCEWCGATEVVRRATRLPECHVPNLMVSIEREHRDGMGAVLPNHSQRVGQSGPTVKDPV